MDAEYNEKQIKGRKKHICVGRCSVICGFLGFKDCPELEDKIYNWLDNELPKDTGFIKSNDTAIIEKIVSFFQKENINDVMFNLTCGFFFHKIGGGK